MLLFKSLGGLLVLFAITGIVMANDDSLYEEDEEETDAPEPEPVTTTKANRASGLGSGNTGNRGQPAFAATATNGTTPKPIPSEWLQKGECACFCFNRQGMVNPPPWVPGQAPKKGTKPTPIPPPENAPPGPTIFNDAVFLGGPPLWDAEECRVRSQSERQYDISFFCTCCCPRPASG